MNGTAATTSAARLRQHTLPLADTIVAGVREVAAQATGAAQDCLLQGQAHFADMPVSEGLSFRCRGGGGRSGFGTFSTGIIRAITIAITQLSDVLVGLVD